MVQESTRDPGNGEVDKGLLDKIKLQYKMGTLSGYDMNVVTWDPRKTSIPFHKIVFVAGSQALAALLNADCVDCQENADGTKNVHISIDADVLYIIQRYLYTGETDVNLNRDMKLALKVLEASIQLDLDDLKKLVVSTIKPFFTVEDAFNVLEVAKAREQPELEERALRLIHRNAGNLLKTEDFVKLGSYDACRILASDDLNCGEVEVFRAAQRWAEPRMTMNNGELPSKCYFSEVAQHVRFPLMSPGDLALVSSEAKYMDPKEIIEILQYKYFPEASRPNLRRNYSTVPRKCSTSHNRPAQQSDSDHYLMPPPNQPVCKGIKRPIPKNDEAIDEVSSSSAPAVDVINHSPAKMQRFSAVEPQLDEDEDEDDDLFIVSITEADKTYNTLGDISRTILRKLRKTEESSRQPTNIGFERIKIVKNHPNVICVNCTSLEIDVMCQFMEVKSGEESRGKILFRRFVRLFDPLAFVVCDTRGCDITADNICSLKQNILLKFNGVTFLKVTHKEDKPNALVMNYLFDSKDILRSPNLLLHKLAISNSGFSSRYLRSKGKELRHLILYRVWGDFTMDEILKDCVNLTELVCWKYIPEVRNMVPTSPPLLDFGRSISARNTLKKLVLYGVELKFPGRCGPSLTTSLKELILEQCFADKARGNGEADICKCFMQLFPKLEKFVIDEKEHGNIATPGLINCLLTKTETIKSIYVERLKWSGDEVDKLATTLSEKSNLTEAQPEYFKLEKTCDGSWIGEILTKDHLAEPTDIDGGYWSNRDQLEFQWFNLINFYDSYETYEDYFLGSLTNFPESNNFI